MRVAGGTGGSTDSGAECVNSTTVVVVPTHECKYILHVLPQSCEKIAIEVDAAFRTPKNPYEIQEIFSIVHAFDAD